MEGNPEQSGYKAASTGDITYFYYHSVDYISNLLIQHSFKIAHLISIKVKRKETTEETDTIIISKKTTTSFQLCDSKLSPSDYSDQSPYVWTVE